MVFPSVQFYAFDRYSRGKETVSISLVFGARISDGKARKVGMSKGEEAAAVI